MNPETFRALSALAYQQAGIHLGEEKMALVSARVGKRLRALSVKDEGAYLKYLKADQTGQELVEFLDVISTNFTSFYREPAHFERLKLAASQWAREGREVTVWCAAASSGEEPYTLAMTLDEVLGDGVPWRLLATDLSTRVLRHAVEATYGQAQVASVPPEIARRSLVRAGPDRWTVSQRLRARITFARLNLAHPPYPMRGPFDAIFCRNVMIYFDAAVRQRVVKEGERLLRPGGLFIVGHAESLSGVGTALRLETPSVYRAPEGR